MGLDRKGQYKVSAMLFGLVPNIPSQFLDDPFDQIQSNPHFMGVVVTIGFHMAASCEEFFPPSFCYGFPAIIDIESIERAKTFKTKM